MPTTIFTPQMLRNGTRAVPEIPVGSSFLNQYSLIFDGTDDYVSTNSKIIGSDITLSGWVNFNGGSYAGNVAQFPMSVTPSNSNVPNETMGRFFKSGRGMEITMQTYDQTGGNYSTYSVRSFDFEGAGWQHVCWTYNVTTKHIYVYLNGVSQTWTNFGGTITTPYLTAVGTRLYESDLTVGRSTPTAPTGTYLGLVDEVSTYNRILTQTEITSISSAPSDLTSLSPVAWYRMGDNGSYKSPQWLIPNNENKDKISNYSMEFDGVNDYVSLTSLVPLGLTSISFWMKSTHSSGNDSITTGLGNLGFIGTTPLVLLRSSNYRYFADQASKFDGEWHHWFLLIAGSGQSDITNSRLFVDGVEISSGTTVNSSTPSPWTSTRIGRGAYGYLNCSINNFAVWEGSDESANVSTIYNSGTPNDISSLSPTAWLKMGEEATFSTNWTVADQVGSNDGTSANMTIEDRIGTAPSSSNNALSYNMDEVDRVEDVPS